MKSKHLHLSSPFEFMFGQRLRWSRPSSLQQRHFLSALTRLKPLCFSSRQREPSLSPRVPAHQCLSPTPPSAASWPAPVQLRTRAARKSVTGTSCTLKTLSPCKSSRTSLFSPFILPRRDLGAARIGSCSAVCAHTLSLTFLRSPFVFPELIRFLSLFHKDVSQAPLSALT